MDENSVFLIAILWIGTVGMLIIWSIFRQKYSAEEAKYREMSRRAAAAKRVSDRGGPEGVAMPAWAEKLVDDLGLGDYLEEEEMPDEIKRLLPLAKGFLDSGGLQKLLATSPGSAQLGPEEGWH